MPRRISTLCICLIGLALLSGAAPARSADEDQGLAGRWRARSGLEVAIEPCPGQGLCGRLVKVPDKLATRYSLRRPLVIKARPSGVNQYQGQLLSPSGRWVKARFVIDPTFKVHMTSHHPGGQKVQWLRVIKLKLPNPAAMEPRSDPREIPSFR